MEDRKTENGGGFPAGVAKFFVSNIPDRASSKEIEETFKVYGEVIGVYVAKKRDKMGNRFGFVTFS
ncbi:putative RNA recognition motif domain, nucleotide-binding alpha-beta plait domain superfamily [Helianthus anomalus]